MKKETWKPVENFEELYEVSNKGKIRSKDRIDRIGRLKRGQLLKEIDNRKGYKYVNLHKDGEAQRKYIHRLVAEAFIGECPKGFEVDHVDRNRGNNKIENLRYIPIKRNRATSAESRTRKVRQYSVDGTLISEYRSTVEASKTTGIHQSCISGVLTGRNKTAGGFIWRRAQNERMTDEKSI